MEWQKYFGGSYSETGYYVHEKDGGGFMVSGYTESYGQGLYDIWIISTDYTGNEIFSQTIGGSLDDKALGGTKASDGKLVIIGYTESFGKLRYRSTASARSTFHHKLQQLCNSFACHPKHKPEKYVLYGILQTVSASFQSQWIHMCVKRW